MAWLSEPTEAVSRWQVRGCAAADPSFIDRHQENEHDFHKVGLTWDFLLTFLSQAGFARVQRVRDFGLFDDFSSLQRFGVLISLNVEAYK